jgi:galactokinase
MPQEQLGKIVETYRQRFNEIPSSIVTAPGRINLIGEHTDYSEGFVLPVAIDRNVTLAFTPRADKAIQVYSIDFDQELVVHLDNIQRGNGGWKEYVMGMGWALMNAGYALNGWQAVVAGNIPIGAGLSSSAALEVAIGKTFCLASNIDLPPASLALLSRKAEAEWVGVNVGIMDQLISAAGKEGHALLLDCKTLDYEYVPIPKEITLVVLDTMTRRELTKSDYNARHEEVKQASSLLGVQFLREATPQLVEKNRTHMTSTIYRRARHVVTENQRVHAFSIAMRNNDISTMGQLINASHESLRDDYEVSSSELNLIVELAQKQPECLGARMMGAGFGGCALALLATDQVERFTENVSSLYRSQTGIEPNIFIVTSADGVGECSVPLDL